MGLSFHSLALAKALADRDVMSTAWSHGKRHPLILTHTPRGSGSVQGPDKLKLSICAHTVCLRQMLKVGRVNAGLFVCAV